MSRFFRGGDDSSSDSSSEEEELYSDEEEQKLEDGADEESSSEEEEEEEAKGGDDSSDDDGETGAARFLKGADSDDEDSDEEVRKKVKSAKDKRFDELESTIRLIDNGKKIDDWGAIATGRHEWVLELGCNSLADTISTQNMTSSTARLRRRSMPARRPRCTSRPLPISRTT